MRTPHGLMWTPPEEKENVADARIGDHPQGRPTQGENCRGNLESNAGPVEKGPVVALEETQSRKGRQEHPRAEQEAEGSKGQMASGQQRPDQRRGQGKAEETLGANPADQETAGLPHGSIGVVGSENIRFDVIFGHVQLETRVRPEGNRLIGEGRSRHYDGNGHLTKDTGWQPTGCVAYWPEPEPRRWWEFWK